MSESEGWTKKDQPQEPKPEGESPMGETNFTQLRDLAAEARAALRRVTPPSSPKQDRDGLYYPLLFLTEQAEATLRHVLAAAHESVTGENVGGARWLARVRRWADSPKCGLLVGGTSEPCVRGAAHPGECDHGMVGYRSDNEHDAPAPDFPPLASVPAVDPSRSIPQTEEAREMVEAVDRNAERQRQQAERE